MSDLWYTAVIIGAACYAYLLVRIIRGLRRLRRIAPKLSSDQPTVSVVIAARNEEKEIRRTIEAVTSQDYPSHLTEIIVVNDRSTDRTAAIVTELCKLHPHLHLLNQTEIDQSLSPKKQAMGRGIRSAKGDIIVTTDADCQPSTGWLTSMVQHFTAEVGMVAGRARFYIEPDAPYWQILQALDFHSQGYAATGLIADDLPFSCSGASLAFRRQLFDEIKGYDGVDKLISGDDELLLAKAAHTDWKIVNAATSAAVVPTRPPATLRELWMQRIRWGSKGLYYNNTRKLVLAGIFLFLLCLTSGPAIMISNSDIRTLWIAFALLKVSLDLAATWLGTRIYGETFNIIDFCVLEILHAPAMVVFAIAGHFMSFEWKGQSFRSRASSTS